MTGDGPDQRIARLEAELFRLRAEVASTRIVVAGLFAVASGMPWLDDMRIARVRKMVAEMKIGAPGDDPAASDALDDETRRAADKLLDTFVALLAAAGKGRL